MGISHWNIIFAKACCYLISDIKSAIVGQELFVGFEWTKSIFTGYSISSMLFLALTCTISHKKLTTEFCLVATVLNVA